MNIYIESKPGGNAIVTIATGGEFLTHWEKNSRAGWEQYCRRHGLGLIVFDEELFDREAAGWKKVHWQKTLIAKALRRADAKVNNVCFLDTDILISPTAPNIFDGYDPTTFGLVSLRRRLPFPYEEVLRRMAFLRHHYYDSNYPLDSALFMSLDQLYGFHNLPVQDDEACTGVILFNVNNHAELMESWFHKYDSDIQSITNGGEQTHLNYEIQRLGRVTWLDYRFQAIWAFEMAWKYPFLYSEWRNDEPLVRSCIEASLYQNHFLHFAGYWHESQMWKIGGFFEDEKQAVLMQAYNDYLDSPVTGIPQGIIRPK